MLLSKLLSKNRHNAPHKPLRARKTSLLVTLGLLSVIWTGLAIKPHSLVADPGSQKRLSQAQKRNPTPPLRITILSDPPGATVYVNAQASGTTGDFQNKELRGVATALTLELDLAGYKRWAYRVPSTLLVHTSSLYIFQQLEKVEVPIDPPISAPPPVPSAGRYCNQPGTRDEQVSQALAGEASGETLDQLRLCLAREKQWDQSIQVTSRLCQIPDRQADCRYNLAFYQYQKKRYRDCLASVSGVIKNPVGLETCDQLIAHQLRISCKTDLFNDSARPGQELPSELNEWVQEFDNMLENTAANAATKEERDCAAKSKDFLIGWKKAFAQE